MIYRSHPNAFLALSMPAQRRKRLIKRETEERPCRDWAPCRPDEKPEAVRPFGLHRRAIRNGEVNEGAWCKAIARAEMGGGFRRSDGRACVGMAAHCH